MGRGADDFFDIQVMSENLTECSACAKAYLVRCFNCDEAAEGDLEVFPDGAFLNDARLHKIRLESSQRKIGLVERRQFGRGAWFLADVQVDKQSIHLSFHTTLPLGQAMPGELAQRCESLKKGIQEVSAQLYKDVSDIAQLPNTKSNGTGSYSFKGPDKEGNGLTWVISWMYRGEAKDVKARLKELQWLVK